jgi:hypothetical protein
MSVVDGNGAQILERADRMGERDAVLREVTSSLFRVLLKGHEQLYAQTYAQSKRRERAPNPGALRAEARRAAVRAVRLSKCALLLERASSPKASGLADEPSARQANVAVLICESPSVARVSSGSTRSWAAALERFRSVQLAEVTIKCRKRQVAGFAGYFEYHAVREAELWSLSVVR